ADQRKEAASGGEVGRDLSLQRVEQLARAAVVDRAARHVDRFDLLGRGLAQRLVVRIADREVLAHDATEASEAEADRPGVAAVAAANADLEPASRQREPQRPGAATAALRGAERHEAVLCLQVTQRHFAFLLDLRAA